MADCQVERVPSIGDFTGIATTAKKDRQKEQARYDANGDSVG